MAAPAPAAPAAEEVDASDETPWERLRAYVATPPPGAEPEPEEADTEPEKPDEPEDDEKPAKGKPAGLLGALRSSRFSQMVERVAALPTPGGLLPLILVILFFLFAIVPSNSAGETRVQLLWRVLTGGAWLPSSAASQKRNLEIQRINDDNAAAAQVARGAGKVVTAAGQVIDEAGKVVSEVQTGWDVFWTGTEASITFLEEHL